MKELLVPVGNMESLIVAVHSGADAVYLGGKKFGARAYANNFDNEEIIKAIKLCHLYGVKIYVTVNTLIYESEIEEALEYLKFLHINGVDAVIVQDIGLIASAHEYLPNLEIHASTQVHNINQDGLKLLEDLGVKRVVFARELSINEINNINTPLEKEVFIHGALCISYSGECLFSSMLMDRSGNRGSCAQICRLPFKMMEEDKYINTEGNYLLSTKELNTSIYFKEIMDSSILSLKIEGRMKSPEYVGCVTKFYRDLIDKYYRGEEVIPDKNLLEDLNVIFNRKYTKGFLFNANNEELMNIKSQNHLGVHLGNIIKTTKKYIYIKLDKPLNQGDGIRFNDINEGMIANFIYNSKEKLISSGNIGDIILLDNKFNITTLGSVNKTLDVLVQSKYTNIDFKRIPININFEANKGIMKLSLNDSINEVEVESEAVYEALNTPITEERIESQLIKLGNTPFCLKDININVNDNLFINIKELNDLRRKACEKLQEVRENVKKEVIINKINEKFSCSYENKSSISILCRNEEQIKASLEMNVNRIYIADKNLYLKYASDNRFYYRTKRIGEDIKYKNILATELSVLYKNKGCIGDYYLNVGNHHTINTLMNYANLLTLSVEMKNDEIEKLMNYYNNKLNVEIIIYSNIELMITKYCPLNMLVNKDKNCHICSNLKKYYLVDRNNKKYRIMSEPDIHLTHIMHYKPNNLMEYTSFYKDLGINNFRIELLEESYIETKELIKNLQEKLNRG